MPRDYYEILGVGREASLDDVKKAYRKVALKHHPDRNPDDSEGAAARFKEASAAYEILSSPEKRAQYDRFGHAAFEGPGGGAGDFASGFGAGAGVFEDVLGDLFGDFFGGGRSRRSRSRAAQGESLRYDLDITFDEAVAGVEKQLSIPRTITCQACSGSGAKSGTKPESCPACNGNGQVRFQQGLFHVSKVCGQCSGEGRINRTPCQKCHGQGHDREMRDIKVKIPAGVDNGSRLKLRGEGEAGRRGGPPGDLYVILTVDPHPIFERDGCNVLIKLPISMVDAAVGAKIDVPTLDGVVKMTIPSGTQSGRLFKISGRGICDLRHGERGDQYVSVEIEIPKKLSRKQRKLLEEFDVESRKNSESVVASFANKVRELMGSAD